MAQRVMLLLLTSKVGDLILCSDSLVSLETGLQTL